MRIALTAANPSITGLSNIYSYIQPGMPNYGIAQGSIFAIFGANLSQGRTQQLQNTPLPVTLQQASVSITVNGTTTQAPLYFASPTQLVAILPSATPVGNGTIVVNNGLSSGSTSIQIVESAFGILTLNAGGTGPAAAFDLNFNYLGFTNALNPGDYFILWGTGVGPVSGDETATQTPADLTGVPMSLEVGGVPAQLYYHGRSTFPGLDQVIGIVPQGVTPGCWVSVVATSGNVVSNFATLPVAAGGSRVCSDPTAGLTPSVTQTLTSKSSLNLGFIELQKSGGTSFHNGTSTVVVSDFARAQFFNVPSSAFSGFTLGPSLGSCLVSNTYNGGAPWGTLASTALDAGSAMSATGPAGSALIPFQSSIGAYLGANGLYLFPPGFIPWQGGGGAYLATVGGGTPTQILPLFIPSNGGGNFTFDNGSGGSGVGSFSATVPFLNSVFSLPQASTLPLSNLSLSQGFTIAWTNADPNSFIQISGRSASAAASSVVEFTCSVAEAAGQFSIPVSVLRSLPVDGAIAANPAYSPQIQISEVGFPQTFSAPGLDLGFAQTSVAFTTGVFYQQ